MRRLAIMMVMTLIGLGALGARSRRRLHGKGSHNSH